LHVAEGSGTCVGKEAFYSKPYFWENMECTGSKRGVVERGVDVKLITFPEKRGRLREKRGLAHTVQSDENCAHATSQARQTGKKIGVYFLTPPYECA
jgi:hypothetical protein